MAPLHALGPSDDLFSTDNVGGEQKIKKGLQMFYFALKNIGEGPMKKKISE